MARELSVSNCVSAGYNDWGNERLPEGRKTVELGLTLVDVSVMEKARQQGVAVDHFERPFARVRLANGEQRVVDLGHQGTHKMGSDPKDWEDMYLARLGDLTDADLNAIRAEGVAFGLRYGNGEDEIVLNCGEHFGFFHLQG